MPLNPTRPEPRWALRLLVALAVMLAGVVVRPTSAEAHASLEGSEPPAEALVASAPSEVVLRFDGPVALDLGAGIRVFGPSGQRVDRGDSELTVATARRGPNLLHRYFFDPNGLPGTVDAAEARVSTTDVPRRRIDLNPITPNHNTASGLTLSSPGTWTFTITTISHGSPPSAASR